MKTKYYILQAVVTLVLLMTGISPIRAYYSDWKYTTTSRDNGRDTDGKNYTFRYDSEDTKGNFMDFRTYYMFNVSKNIFAWNWDIRVNYGTIDNGNTTHIVVTLEDGDGWKHKIAEADFVGYNAPTVTYSNRQVFFSRIQDSGDLKYMFTLEYQPSDYDLREGIKRIYIYGCTKWNGGKNVRNFQYERDLDISSYTNMSPSYNAELDNEGNFIFNVTGTSTPESSRWVQSKDLETKISYGYSSYGSEWKHFYLTEDARNGGTDDKANYKFTVPVKSYTVPLRLSQTYYTIDVKKHLLFNHSISEGSYKYTIKTANGDAFDDGILFKPYTRVNQLKVEFDKWKKQNIIQWTRNKQVGDSRNSKIDCQTDGTWYVLRYEKGEAPSTYEILKEIPGSNENLKVEDNNIEYDHEYVYRVVFLPSLLKDKFADKLTRLPGEGERHTQYDLWEEQTVNTAMEVPIHIAQDRSDDTGIHLTWDYNVQTNGCEWRIDKHHLGTNTWTTVTTLPVDTRQSHASYVETGGSVCDLYVYRIMTRVNGYELYSDTLICNLPAGAYISEVKASTGTEEKNVIIKWKVARPGDDDIQFRIMRRPIGTDEWTLLTDEIHGHATEYSYIDDRVMAGSYYEYTVEAYGAKCDGQLVKTDTQVTPGFSQARGTITGHIAYGSGTAVQGVRVNIVKSSADTNNDQVQFLSRHIDGEGKGLQWVADSAKYAGQLNGQKELTLQLWAKPLVGNGATTRTLLYLNNALELGVKNTDGMNSYLYAKDVSNDGTAITEFSDLIFSATDFTHVAATYKRGQWTFYVGTDTLRTASMTAANTDWNACKPNSQLSPAYSTLSIGGSQRLVGNAFTGYVDDIRLWNRALGKQEIEDNHTRILSGNDNGLILYWPLDEGLNVKKYSFDVARQDGIYQLNHPEVGVNAQPSTEVPSMLALYGITDAEGDYIIRGVPFQQGGTNYKIVPDLGIHEFNPNSTSMFVSPTSLTANSVNFEDVSSFPLEGYVYYAGTNIPAEGIMLYVDGDPQSEDGKSVQTDANGYYKVAVPIGEHYVEAKLEGHTMVDGGRFPTKGRLNFNRAMTHDFADSTLVNFIGRVGGGTRCDTLAVGFGATKNNIGMATITLKLNNESFLFNCQDDHISDATTDRPWASDTTSIRSRSWTGTGYNAKYIFIRTDSLTGEFSAMLPPLKYITKSVSVASNPDIEFTSLPTIDLTNVLKELTDSMKVVREQGDSALVRYKYNTKKVFTHFARPQLDVLETKHERGAFGLQKIEDYIIDYGTSRDTLTIDSIWKRKADGSIDYLMGYPIYQMEDSICYDLFAYEAYINRDDDVAVHDTIPLNGQVIRITNEMSTEQKVVAYVENPESEIQPGSIYNPKDDEVRLGKDGRASYTWHVGAPNIVSPYTRHFSTSFVRNDRTYLGQEVDAVVLGFLIDGNNFVTKGPDDVKFVLRDPPGSKSSTKLRKAVIKTKESYDAVDGYGDYKLMLNHQWGIETDVAAGIGVMAITGHKVLGQLDTGVHATWDYLQTHEELTTTSITETFSTSTGYPYYGSKGDVYIGNSSNLLIGSCRNLHITRSDANSPFKFVVEDALSVGKEISTTFVYTQYELMTVMIPKWKDMRKSYMTEVDSKDTALTYKNTGDRSVYLTWIDPEDKNYGKEGFYRYVKPQDSLKITKSECDSVEWCTQQIERWEDIIAKNEQDKVESMATRSAAKGWVNYSIDGGASYTYTERNDTTNIWRSRTTWKVGGVIGGGSTIHFKAGASYLMVFNITTETGGGRIEGGGDNKENYTEWEYTLCDGNRDTDISIDKFPSGRSGYSPVFSIFGGQTYNPYEEQEVTHYYKPGTPLGNATLQMEQPNISISVNGKNPSKNITVTDIPSGQEMNLTLHCTNLANVHQGVNFLYDLIVAEPTNVNGLQILMDGVPVNGRSLLIPQNETVTKQITIKQTDQSILDYEGVMLRFCSKYEPLIINDDVFINAHFMPSSSPIDLAASEPVLNIETLDRDSGNVVLKLTNFNRTYKNLKYLGVQYRYEGNTQWNTIHTYVINKKDSLDTSYSLLPDVGTIRHTYNMKDDNFFPQGTYTFRAFTTTPYGPEQVTVYSDEVTVIKDNVRPRNLTTPEPANGILHYGDDIFIEFNEDIVPGYVSDKNIIVTAKLNDQPVVHEVAKRLRPWGDEQVTLNPIFLNGDFSIDFWMRWEDSGSILRLGEGQFALSIDETGHIVTSLGGAEAISRDMIPKNEWTYIVLSYKSAEKKFSALAQYGTTTLQLFSNQKVNEGAVQMVYYSDDNHLYLGNMNGAMHDLSLFNIYRDVHEAVATKNQTKDNYDYGLVNYWPMNEGHGHTATDTRHTHDFYVTDSWLIDNANYSLTLPGDTPAKADISRINTSPGDSYAIEMWVNPGLDTDNDMLTVFESGTQPANRLGLYIHKLYIDELYQYEWILRYGEHEQIVVSHEDFPWIDDWTHVALNVVRGQAASFYYNGQRTAVIAEHDVPPLEGKELTLGKDMGEYTGYDEVRIWHASLSESHLLANMYNCIDTTDIYSRGLVAYYPFEKAGNVDGVDTKVETLENLAPHTMPGGTYPEIAAPDSFWLAESSGPALKNAPVESRIIAKPITSERKLVIRMEEGNGIKKRDIEGTTLNITVDKIYDMHGNASSPIRWTTYVQLNTLKWMKDSVNVIKQYGDDYTFDVNIENRGGNTEYYTLYNMPQWLKLIDSERTDDVAPLTTKILRFEVDPLVAVGNYDVTIGLQGNNEILEPLRIVMKVSGQKPDWTVDPTMYDHQMNIIGQVYINGILMENPESMVAAFIGNECRGMASPTKVRGAAYVTMTIYGNDTRTGDRGKAVNFRIWDASKGVAYTDAQIAVGGSAVDVTFQQDKIIGDFDTPAIFTKSNMVEQLIPIHKNWNWIALGVEPQSDYLDQVFSDLSDWKLLIKNRTYYSDYNGAEWNGTLVPKVNEMYKLKVEPLPNSQLSTPSSQLSVSGRQPSTDKLAVEIHKDWNWIAYTPLTTIAIDEALIAANPQKGDIVKSQTGVSIYGYNGWEGNLQALESGRGYMYYSTDSTVKTFIYPNASLTSARANRYKAEATSSLSIFTPVDKYLYPNNMTMAIQLKEGIAVVDTAEVAAFVGDECRGATRANSNGLYYLVIAGEGAGQPMTLRTCINGKIITIDDSQQFVSDDNIGTSWEPYVIDLDNTTVGINRLSGSADDNDTEWYTLQGFRIGRKPTLPGVYIHNGEKVIVGMK